MPHTYTASAPNPADPPITWQDRKRGCWAMSVIWPLMPFVGIPFVGLWAHHASGWQIALGAPLGDKASAEGGCGSPPSVRSTSKGQEQPPS